LAKADVVQHFLTQRHGLTPSFHPWVKNQELEIRLVPRVADMVDRIDQIHQALRLLLFKPLQVLEVLEVEVREKTMAPMVGLLLQLEQRGYLVRVTLVVLEYLLDGKPRAAVERVRSGLMELQLLVREVLASRST
jgi:hypothetical protein